MNFSVFHTVKNTNIDFVGSDRSYITKKKKKYLYMKISYCSYKERFYYIHTA